MRSSLQEPESGDDFQALPPLPGRLRHTLRALLFASLICTGMLGVRLVYAGNFRLRFLGLFGNLLLAWVPLVFSLLIRRIPPGTSRRRFWGVLGTWVLFFPNAFYITTDLIHTRKFGGDGVYRWYDMLMTASFACVGVFVGSLSLYLIHLFVRARLGHRAGWLFAGGMLGLGSFGIYLGRYLRLNSWDVVTRPLKLGGDILSLAEPIRLTEVAAFSVTFFFFSVAVYSCLVSMARLHEVPLGGDGANGLGEKVEATSRRL